MLIRTQQHRTQRMNGVNFLYPHVLAIVRPLTEEDLGIKDGIDDESLSCRHHSVGDSLFERT